MPCAYSIERKLKFLEGRVVQFVYIKLESFQIGFKEQCSEYSCEMLKEKYQKIVSVAFPSAST